MAERSELVRIILTNYFLDPNNSSLDHESASNLLGNLLTEQARRVIEYAMEEAKDLQYNYIGSQHLLLGFLREDNGAAAHVLKEWFGADAEKVRSAVEFIRKPGDEPSSTTLEVEPNTKQIIQLAAEEAYRLNHPLVGTEHLLLGLLMQESNIAQGILEAFGIYPGKVRKAIIAVLQQKETVDTAEQDDGKSYTS